MIPAPSRNPGASPIDRCPSASPDPHRLRFALSACTFAGLEISPHRRRLLETLAQHPEPVIARDLITRLAAETGAHPVTFYRSLQRLEACGIVESHLLRGRRAVFLGFESVDCLVCIDCGAITRLPEPAELRSWQDRLAQLTGFRLTRHWYEINGVCPDCAGPGDATPRHAS